MRTKPSGAGARSFAGGEEEGETESARWPPLRLKESRKVREKKAKKKKNLKKKVAKFLRAKVRRDIFFQENENGVRKSLNIF